MSTASARSGKRWTTLVLRVLGFALLGFILWSVEWRDSVRLQDGSLLRGEIVGTIPDDWSGDATVAFRQADAPAESPPRTIAAAELGTVDVRGQAVPAVNEGLIRVVERAEKGWIVFGVLLFGLTLQFGVVRWWLLLRDQGIRIAYGVAYRLTFIGFFFNSVVPGATGGDVVKAVYAARSTDKRAEAVITVLVDRIVGIVALALIAACALTTRLGQPAYDELALFVFGFLGCFVLGCFVFFSRRLRRVLHVDAIAAKLPFGSALKRVDDAAFMYRYQKKGLLVALLLSFANQLSIQFIVILFAHALHVTTRGGEPLPIGDYMVVLPVGWMVSALPLLPGGWGLRESAFVVAFHLVGVARSPAIALSVLSGMNMLLWSLLGGVYVILDKGAVAAAAAQGAAEAGAASEQSAAVVG